MTLERRYLPIEDLETRTKDNKFQFVGHVARFNRWSEELRGGFREMILPGAFRKTTQESDIRVLFNHNPNFVLGRNRSKTAVIEEDAEGLFVDVMAPDAQWVRDLHESVKRGDISDGSFGFRPVRQERSADFTERRLQEVRLLDASIVTFPAYEDSTDVSARSTEYVQGLTQMLRSGAELKEEDLVELRRLLEKTVAPVESHPTADDASSREPLTDLATRIRLLRAAA